MTTWRCSTVAVAFAVSAFAAGGAFGPAHAQEKAAMSAKLLDPDKKAASGGATVEVTTSGVQLTDPALSNEKPVPGQGHLHYQVDKGPVVATPTAKLSYHELAPGSHTILVVLVGNDHKPLGPQQQLVVTVPKAPSAASTTGPSGVTPGTEKPKAGY